MAERRRMFDFNEIVKTFSEDLSIEKRFNSQNMERVMSIDEQCGWVII